KRHPEKQVDPVRAARRGGVANAVADRIGGASTRGLWKEPRPGLTDTQNPTIRMFTHMFIEGRHRRRGWNQIDEDGCRKILAVKHLETLLKLHSPSRRVIPRLTI